MAQYRTAQGRMIDMSALVSKNERTRAVGNMKVNARGDTVDSQGRIIEPITTKVTNQYAKTVGNKQARPVAKPQQPPKPKIVEEKLPTEEDFNDSEDVEIEQIKQQEAKEQEKKKAKK